MKKIILIMLILIISYVPVFGSVDLVKNWQFDDGLDDWSNSANQWHVRFEEDGNDQYIRFGWVDNLGIWQDIGEIQADTVYQMHVKAKNWDGKCEGIWLKFKDTDPNVGVIVEQEQWFTYGATNPGPDPNDPYPWEEFTITMDTSTSPADASVGKNMYAVVRLSDYAIPWGQYCWLGVTSVSVLPDRPIIVNQPVSNVADPNAEFMIGVASQSDANYAWYLSDDDVIGSDVSVGTDSETLVLENVDINDAGKYVYCVTTNATAYSATSDMALLDVQRLMAQWKVNDDLLDETDDDWDGSCASPVFSPNGIEGSAISFTADVNDANRVTITGSEDAFNKFDAGITASAWVKTSATGQWQVIMAKRQLDLDNSGWILAITNTGLPHFSIRDSGVSVNGQTVVNDGQWHLITGVYNGSTQEANIYVDALSNADTVIADNVPPLNPAGQVPVVIGAESVSAGVSTSPFEGLVDDARIYNYGLDPYGVIDIYNDVIEPDVHFCLEVDILDLDVTGPEDEPDCRIDMLDFAALASEWMTSGLYPSVQ